jgi:hypothetical protein
MTDRELLEAAAKAAGLKVQIWDGHSGLMCAVDDVRHGRMWMPLTDDGDALRLAVKLRLRVCTPTTDTDCALVSNGNVVAYSEDELEEVTITDLYAATRRAIVRAAAEIGKAMK